MRVAAPRRTAHPVVVLDTDSAGTNKDHLRECPEQLEDCEIGRRTETAGLAVHRDGSIKAGHHVHSDVWRCQPVGPGIVGRERGVVERLQCCAGRPQAKHLLVSNTQLTQLPEHTAALCEVVASYRWGSPTEHSFHHGYSRTHRRHVVNTHYP